MRPCPPRSARPARPRSGSPGRGRWGRWRQPRPARSRHGRVPGPRAVRTGARGGPAARRPDRTSTSSTSPARTARAARSASPVPRGSSWRAVSATPVDGVAHRDRGRRVDDERAGRGGGHRRIEHVLDHRPATDRVEDLGHARLHAHPEARRQHDGHGPSHLRPGARRGHGAGRRAGRAGPDAAGAAASAGAVLIVIGGAANSAGGPSRVSTNRSAPGASCHRPDRLAIASISTRPAFGRAATWTVERAGGGSGR